jgi:hypothetical protein
MFKEKETALVCSDCAHCEDFISLTRAKLDLSVSAPIIQIKLTGPQTRPNPLDFFCVKNPQHAFLRRGS